MIEKKFTIETIPNMSFRIRSMNGIEALAARQVLVKGTEGDMISAYHMMLEKYIEVELDKDKWMKCKEGNNFYPDGLEDNVQALVEIMNKFVEYVQSFFVKSNA